MGIAGDFADRLQRMVNSRATLYLGFILGLGVLFVVLWAQLEKRYIFFPTSEIENTPDQAGLVYEDVYFATEDGLELNGWFIPGDEDVTWLWLHGNGGNIGHRVEELAMINRRLKVNQLIFDYRGYGKSTGKPTEQGTYLDSRAALAYLGSRSDVEPDKIVYFGRSLGAAVAVELAANHPPLGLTLVSPFASMGDMARVAYPFLPVHLLVRNRYDSLNLIRQIHRPVLILHGDQDETVPFTQGQKLYQAANPPKQFQALPGARHNDTYYGGINGGSVYWDALADFLNALKDGSGAGDRE